MKFFFFSFCCIGFTLSSSPCLAVLHHQLLLPGFSADSLMSGTDSDTVFERTPSCILELHSDSVFEPLTRGVLSCLAKTSDRSANANINLELEHFTVLGENPIAYAFDNPFGKAGELRSQDGNFGIICQSQRCILSRPRASIRQTAKIALGPHFFHLASLFGIELTEDADDCSLHVNAPPSNAWPVLTTDLKISCPKSQSGEVPLPGTYLLKGWGTRFNKSAKVEVIGPGLSEGFDLIRRLGEDAVKFKVIDYRYLPQGYLIESLSIQNSLGETTVICDRITLNTSPGQLPKLPETSCIFK